MKKLTLIAILIFLITFGTKAQPGFDDDVEDVPLDGGIAILTGAIVAYGLKQQIKKTRDRDPGGFHSKKEVH